MFASSASSAYFTVFGKAFGTNEDLADGFLKNGLCSKVYAVRDGGVRSTTPSFGVFVDTGAGTDAFMRGSQISFERISKEDFGQMFSAGYEIKLTRPEGLPMQAPCIVQPVCTFRMHAQLRAQLQPMAVHPMGHPTSFTTSRGSWECMGKMRGRSCWAAALSSKRSIEASPNPKTIRSFSSDPIIGEEDELVQEELMLRLQMTSRQAAQVVKGANHIHRGTPLRLHNLRGWIETLVSFGLSIDDVSGGLRMSPALIKIPASGREKKSAESIRVLAAHGLSEYQILNVLSNYPAVLVSLTPSSLDAKLLRLKELGFPPSMEKGLLEKCPYILTYSLKWDTVQWLVGEGFAPEVARRMIKGCPTLIGFSPETNLSKKLDYYTWLLGSREDACSILAKQYKLFGSGNSSVHAKLAYLVDKLDIDAVAMMKQNYGCVKYSMDAKTGPRTLLLRSLGGAESFKVYSRLWLALTDEAFVQHSSFRALWEDRPRDVLQGADDLKEGLELCKEQWVREGCRRF